MSVPTPARIHARTALVILIATVSVPPALTGCSRTRPAVQTSARPTNLNSLGLQKLTPQQVDAQIRAVQANPTLPESAKPNIISSIRAQGQP